MYVVLGTEAPNLKYNNGSSSLVNGGGGDDRDFQLPLYY